MRTDFERLIAYRSLELVSNLRNEKITEMLINSGSADSLMKNLCTKVTFQLSERIDNTCKLLSISKREFCEAAFIEALNKADAIMGAEGVFVALNKNISEDVMDAYFDHLAEQRQEEEERQSILEDYLERDQD